MAGSTSGISPSFLGLSRSSGQVTHVLLTRSRLCPRPKPGSSLHLHVLSTPPAFVLSQDQTLREELLSRMSLSLRHTRDGRTHGPIRALRRGTAYCLISGLPPTDRREGGPAPGSNLDAHRLGQVCQADSVRMLLSFQRPSRPWGFGGDSSVLTRARVSPSGQWIVAHPSGLASRARPVAGGTASTAGPDSSARGTQRQGRPESSLGGPHARPAKTASSVAEERSLGPSAPPAASRGPARASRGPARARGARAGACRSRAAPP